MKLSNTIWIVLLLAFVGMDVASPYVVRLTSKEQEVAMIVEKINCYQLLVNTTEPNSTDEVYCPMIWDNVMCWPYTPAGTVAKQHCPSYINKFKTHEFAYRECSANGTWYHPREVLQSGFGWTNFTLCPSNETEPRNEDPPKVPVIRDLVRKHVEAFRLMYNIGYGLSLVSLLLAVFIMLYFRKLHCARNYIHLNLFIAFLIRALLNIIRENVWIHYLGFPKDVQELPNKTIIFTEGSHWECRLFFSIYQYGIVSSYVWIFVEAIYIHMVIFVNVFTEMTRVVWYMVFGWTLPLPFVIAWAISRLYLDNSYCWHIAMVYPGLSWIINAPVMLIVVLNSIFFVNIVRLLLTKLNSFPTSDSNRYRTLARSVVVLIPLFGVYYILFQLPVDQFGDTASFIFLFIEMFFNSYQGLFIAVLLCFTNSEVRSEVKRSWKRLQFRPCSTLSRASQMNSFQNQQRSFSTTTKVSEISRLQSLNKRYADAVKSCPSSDPEETVPFTEQEQEQPRYEEMPRSEVNDVINENEVNVNSQVPYTNGIDSSTAKPCRNDHTPRVFPEELELKINVVNIECKNRDGVSRNTTSLGIQALKNGCPINAENIINNNVQETPISDQDGQANYHVSQTVS